MLALSVLDSILTMDKFHQWMMFLSSKGYLQHLVDSIGADDEKLIMVLRGNVENLKVLYLFESKMVCWNFLEQIRYEALFEPRHEKTGFLHIRKQRRRSASW